MSKIVKVYDLQRTPPEWNRLLSGSQVAVFTEDAAGEIPIVNDSSEPTCEIFDNLELAERHCRDVVVARPHLRCMVFDSRGRGADPVAIYESENFRSRELTGRFRRWFSSTLILISVFLIWLDWRSEFERMWPSILAWKLITTALVFITWEAALLTQKFIAKRRQSTGMGHS